MSGYVVLWACLQAVMPERQRDHMPKRPSLFAPRPTGEAIVQDTAVSAPVEVNVNAANKRPPSRAGKRVLSIYLDPIAWRQLRDLALDLETSTQALGEEAINLLFEKHHRNRSA